MPHLISDITSNISKIADDLFTSDEEKAKIDLESKRIETSLMQGQIEINKTEAQHKSLFIAGWRPFIGWIGGISLCYQFLVYPIFTWIAVNSGLAIPPDIDTSVLYNLIVALLGIGAMRSYDKAKGTSTDKIGK